MGSWVEAKTAGCGFGDARLNRHLLMMMVAVGERPGKSLPTAFQDWANTKAAYRFFSNETVSEDKILACHFGASALQVQATDAQFWFFRTPRHSPSRALRLRRSG